MNPELIGNAFIPVVIAVAGFLVVVLGSFTAAIRRLDREVKRSGEQRDELLAENADLRETVRVGEDDRHALRREMAEIRSHRDQLLSKLEAMDKQITMLFERQTKYEEEILRLRTEIESERRDAQRRIDAEGMARQKAELKAVKLENEMAMLVVQKDALAVRLEDQATAHAAEIAALKAQAERLEAESRLLSRSIDDRIQTATGQLRDQVHELINEREALELRVHELENKGVDPEGS